jgi:hypothetical protein
VQWFVEPGILKYIYIAYSCAVAKIFKEKLMHVITYISHREFSVRRNPKRGKYRWKYVRRGRETALAGVRT